MTQYLQILVFITGTRQGKFVKKIGIIALTICVNLTLNSFASAEVEDAAILERIRKSGTVCVEGTDCAQVAVQTTSTVAAVAADTNTTDGSEAVYKKTCATCHAIGVAGAPKLGDAAAWEPRLSKGMDALYASSINGMPPGMPAKGMCFTCSDDELKAVVDYMVGTVKN
jgi:cytochrome c5